MNRILGETKKVEFDMVVKSIEVSSVLPSEEGKVKIGALVRVRYFGDGKTYLGFYLGNHPCEIGLTYNTSTKRLLAYGKRYGAIFIPRLKKIVDGMGSGWYKILEESDTDDVTSKDKDMIMYAKEILRKKNKS
ncbi:hypothetical protein COU57_03540 [Candidatus Pacearchaeota archaeon CG10_big_fil_rev_8_21_14_0_10_32_14]|nr:MAG: hypothetical protein COU57_03540 [Candidatus Pacearchaeota archaeon CG10_big_fil_rev_8_21_14_0_10_32_14]